MSDELWPMDKKSRREGRIFMASVVAGSLILAFSFGMIVGILW